MKKLSLIFLSLLFVLSAWAQEENTSAGDNDEDYEIPEIEHLNEGLTSSLNYANIAGTNYIGFRFKPELKFGKIGFGLDIPLLFNLENGSLRLDEFKDGVGYLRMVRYFFYGVKKRDPLYFRIGELDDSELGFGALISEYNNSPSFDKRKLGVEFDFVLKKQFGLEVLYSDINLTSLNLLGVRPYFKPFGATEIPVLKTFEIGAGIVTDHDKTYWVKNDSVQVRNNYFLSGSGITAYQADMGFYLFNWRWLRWSFYTQAGLITKVYADTLTKFFEQFPENEQFQNYSNGYGWSVGSDFKFRFLGNLLKVNARAEKFWHSAYYIPRFFNYAYEMNKDLAIIRLINTEKEKGTYAMVHASVLDKVVFKASLKFDDIINETHPAEFYAGLDVSGLFDKLTFYTYAYQADITSFKDLFYLTENTLFHTRLGYTVFQLKEFLKFNTGVDFMWTYALIKNRDFTATHYFNPYFSVTMPILNKEKKEEKPEDL